MTEHPPFPHRSADAAIDLLRLTVVKGQCVPVGVPFIPIPAFKECIARTKLDEIAVESVFRRPVDQIQYMFGRGTALDRNASVTILRRKIKFDVTLRGAAFGDHFPVACRIEEPAAQFAEKMIDAKQHTAAVFAPDLPPAAPD